MAQNYDPAKEPCNPLYYAPCYECNMCAAGPGGNTTNIENNEKGILETGLFEVISKHQHAELSATHPRVGIYADGNTD